MSPWSTLSPPESDALSDADAERYLAKLHGLFSAEELNIHGGEPLPGSFAARIQTPEFWQYDPSADARIAHSIVVQSYLGDCLGVCNDDDFANALRVWVNSFHASRHDLQTGRDVLAMFLIHNLESLLHIYILDQADSQQALMSVEVFRMFYAEPEKLATLTEARFSQWVLEDWLPLHLRYYRQLDLETEQALRGSEFQLDV
jgi:hypothetical protein